MRNLEKHCVILIDYDNLLHSQKSAGILDVVTKALIQFPFEPSETRLGCDVRVYGGWYEGATMTRMAQDVAVELQRDFPVVLRLPVELSPERRVVAANAELALSMLQEPGHHLFNTYRRKGKPTNVRVEEPGNVGCTDPGCVLPLMKKLLTTGNCPKLGCGATAADLVYRHEQKIVDTMLTCDLIYAVTGGGVQHIGLVSGDDDFLPPLRTVSLAGSTAVRFHPKPNQRRASFPPGGAILHEREL